MFTANGVGRRIEEFLTDLVDTDSVGINQAAEPIAEMRCAWLGLCTR